MAKSGLAIFRRAQPNHIDCGGCHYTYGLNFVGDRFPAELASLNNNGLGENDGYALVRGARLLRL